MVIRSKEDEGTSFDESDSGILACGTLGSIIVNPDLVSLPIDATSDGDAFGAGSEFGNGTDYCYPGQAPDNAL